MDAFCILHPRLPKLDAQCNKRLYKLRTEQVRGTTPLSCAADQRLHNGDRHGRSPRASKLCTLGEVTVVSQRVTAPFLPLRSQSDKDAAITIKVCRFSMKVD